MSQTGTNKTRKTRVAVYIRIGGTGEIETGYQAMKDCYSEMVDKNPDWELAGFYADLGADSRKQPNLQRLISDCKAERIDLIVTKSVSRFSRNIVEAMKTIRDLLYLKHPVGVYFENENLNTLTKDNLFMLTLFEATALAESELKKDGLPTPCTHLLKQAGRKKARGKPGAQKPDAKTED